MKRIWGGAFFGVGSKLVTHGGAGWRCRRRLPARRSKTLAEITGGRLSEREWKKAKGYAYWVPIEPGDSTLKKGRR